MGAPVAMFGFSFVTSVIRVLGKQVTSRKLFAGKMVLRGILRYAAWFYSFPFQVQWNPAITNPAVTKTRYNEQHLKARKNYSKICGNKPRYNEPRYNEIPGITNWFDGPNAQFTPLLRIFCPVARSQ